MMPQCYEMVERGAMFVLMGFEERKTKSCKKLIYILLRHTVQHIALGQHLVSLSNNHTQCEHVK